VIDHIFFWDDALRPWIHARDPADSKHPRKFTFRVIPRDMREIYFRGSRQQHLHCDPLPRPHTAADPFDTPEQIVIRERINCVNSLAHWQIITESESIKEPRGRSRSQSYSQIALLHSHLFLHDQLIFADISGTDKSIAGCLSALLDCDSEYIFSERLVNSCP